MEAGGCEARLSLLAWPAWTSTNQAYRRLHPSPGVRHVSDNSAAFFLLGCHRLPAALCGWASLELVSMCPSASHKACHTESPDLATTLLQVLFASPVQEVGVLQMLQAPVFVVQWSQTSSREDKWGLDVTLDPASISLKVNGLPAGFTVRLFINEHAPGQEVALERLTAPDSLRAHFERLRQQVCTELLAEAPATEILPDVTMCLPCRQAAAFCGSSRPRPWLAWEQHAFDMLAASLPAVPARQRPHESDAAALQKLRRMLSSRRCEREACLQDTRIPLPLRDCAARHELCYQLTTTSWQTLTAMLCVLHDCKEMLSEGSGAMCS